MPQESTPSSSNVVRNICPNASSPTAPIKTVCNPNRAAATAKIAGAPLANGPRNSPGRSSGCPAAGRMISTRISPRVMILEEVGLVWIIIMCELLAYFLC